jgi:hypothetical protein
MNKEVTICFRTNDELRKALETMARADRRSLSSVIEIILTDHLGKTLTDQKERRRYARKPVTLPAYVTTIGSHDARHGAVVLDLSLGGLCMSMPKDCVSKIYGGNDLECRFAASFVVPERPEPIRVVCRAERVVPSNEEVHVGASVIDADFADYQSLQKFLM